MGALAQRYWMSPIRYKCNLTRLSQLCPESSSQSSTSLSLVCHVRRASDQRLIALPLATIQNLLLLAIGAYPSYLILSQKRTTLSTTDIALGVFTLIDLALEFTADNQQYAFQTFKHSKPRRLKAKKEEWLGARIHWTEEDAERGYVSKGLWAWSRHPNFVAEQTFWVCSISLSLAVLVVYPWYSGPSASFHSSLVPIASAHFSWMRPTLPWRISRPLYLVCILSSRRWRFHASLSGRPCSRRAFH